MDEFEHPVPENEDFWDDEGISVIEEEEENDPERTLVENYIPDFEELGRSTESNLIQVKNETHPINFFNEWFKRNKHNFARDGIPNEYGYVDSEHVWIVTTKFHEIMRGLFGPTNKIIEEWENERVINRQVRRRVNNTRKRYLGIKLPKTKYHILTGEVVPVYEDPTGRKVSPGRAGLTQGEVNFLQGVVGIPLELSKRDSGTAQTFNSWFSRNKYNFCVSGEYYSEYGYVEPNHILLSKKMFNTIMNKVGGNPEKICRSWANKGIIEVKPLLMGDYSEASKLVRDSYIWKREMYKGPKEEYIVIRLYERSPRYNYPRHHSVKTKSPWHDTYFVEEQDVPTTYNN